MKLNQHHQKLNNVLKQASLIIALICFQNLASGQQTTTTRPRPPSFEQNMSATIIPLWAQGAPFAKGEAEEDVPALAVFTPQRGLSNGTAVIIAPGGGYRFLASNLEGRQIADWFTARGVTAFVLRYRLGTKYLYPVPLIDAQRAVRWVRASAKKYGIDPNRIGMMGFSAGGHLTAMTGTAAGYEGNPNAADTVDRVNAKPNFLVLAYPWNNAMQPSSPPYIDSYQKSMGVTGNDIENFTKLYHPAALVNNETPKTFIYGTTDDKVVPASASVDFYTALVKAGVPAELHLFNEGQHGLGLAGHDPALEFWPALLSQWLRKKGMLPEKK